jgi:hypothetical protein
MRLWTSVRAMFMCVRFFGSYTVSTHIKGKNYTYLREWDRKRTQNRYGHTRQICEDSQKRLGILGKQQRPRVSAAVPARLLGGPRRGRTPIPTLADRVYLGVEPFARRSSLRRHAYCFAVTESLAGGLQYGPRILSPPGRGGRLVHRVLCVDCIPGRLSRDARG